jgi:Transglutaminase-like enzymes, putative cysteine proteases
MQVHRKLSDNIANLFLALVMSMSIVYASTSSMGLKYPLYYIAFYIAIFLIIFSIMFISKKSVIISAVLLGLFFTAAVFLLIKKDLYSSLRILLEQYSYWLFAFIENGGLAIHLYVNITVVLLCFVTSAYTFAFIYKRFMFLLILIPGSIFFVIQWAYDFVLSLTPFYIFLFSILMCYLRFVHKKKAVKTSNDYVGTAGILLWAIPVCIVAVMISNIIKADEKPIEWKWMDKKINSIYNSISQKFDYATFDYFSVASSGFGESESILGGRVKLNKTHVLTVETDERIYLKGSAYDKYTGSKWVDSSISNIRYSGNYKAQNWDLVEMSFGMSLFTQDQNFLDKYFNKEKVNVTYQNIKTKSIFIPVKISTFTPKKKDFKCFLDSNGTMISDTRETKGFSYTLEVLVPKQDDPLFVDALRKSQKNLYKQIHTNNRNTIQILSYLNQAAEKNYTTYLQLPDTVPKRVYDLADSLTYMYDNDYDKVKALENFLSSEFPYNLTVRSTPRGRDFVDYFLFDLKEGYCTYYASALTILSRCIGIPARYVEGYVLPPNPTEKNSKQYDVTNQQAHAWTEVYFEGYGWLPFEPTAPFRSSFYSTPQENVQYSSNMETSPAFEDYMDMMKQYNQSAVDTSINVDIPKEKETPYLLYTSILIGIFTFMFCIFLLFNNLKMKIKIYKLMNLSSRESVLGLYKYFLAVLAIQGKQIKADETPFEYAERIDKNMYFTPIKFNQVTGIFIKSRYSTIETSDREKQIFYEFNRQLINETKYNLGKFRFFLLRNVLGKV